MLQSKLYNTDCTFEVFERCKMSQSIKALSRRVRMRRTRYADNSIKIRLAGVSVGYAVKEKRRKC